MLSTGNPTQSVAAKRKLTNMPIELEEPRPKFRRQSSNSSCIYITYRKKSLYLIRRSFTPRLCHKTRYASKAATQKVFSASRRSYERPFICSHSPYSHLAKYCRTCCKRPPIMLRISGRLWVVACKRSDHRKSKFFLTYSNW